MHPVALATAALLADPMRISQLVQRMQSSRSQAEVAQSLQEAIVLLHGMKGDADNHISLLLAPLAGLPAVVIDGWAAVTKACPGAWLVDVGWRLQSVLHAGAASAALGGDVELQSWWARGGGLDSAAEVVCAVVHPLRKRITSAENGAYLCT